MNQKLIEQLIQTIAEHRSNGRRALLEEDLDRAYEELWAAREADDELDLLGGAAQRLLPDGWEIETDLTTLARALSSRCHPRSSEVWCRVLEDTPARSIQAEAAEWLAREASGNGCLRTALRILHAAGPLGRGIEPEAFRAAYRSAGLDPAAAFALYLTAVRLEPHAARAADMRDPLTNACWPDQDGRWWREPSHALPEGLQARLRATQATDHQSEALTRAGHLALTRRDEGWLLLAQGDFLAGPQGARPLARGIRAGNADQADHEEFMRIRLAYEGAADRLPNVAWPWYRLAELLGWAGFPERAQEHYTHAERLSVGEGKAAEKQRAPLRDMVALALGSTDTARPTGPRPFPPVPYGQQFGWRLRRR